MSDTTEDLNVHETDVQEDVRQEHTPEDDGVRQPDPTEGDGVTRDNPTEDAPSQTQGTDEEPDTFPRDYVEKLRDENAKYRQRAQRSDDLAKRLHTALVGATGRLQDPSDLPFEESHLDDPEVLAAAIEGLLRQKPHLASRRPVGDVGQGASAAHGTVDLAGLLRSRA